MKTYTLGAGQFVEFILTRERIKTKNDDVNCGSTSLIYIDCNPTINDLLQFDSRKSSSSLSNHLFFTFCVVTYGGLNLIKMLLKDF